MGRQFKGTALVVENRQILRPPTAATAINAAAATQPQPQLNRLTTSTVGRREFAQSCLRSTFHFYTVLYLLGDQYIAMGQCGFPDQSSIFGNWRSNVT